MRKMQEHKSGLGELVIRQLIREYRIEYTAPKDTGVTGRPESSSNPLKAAWGFIKELLGAGAFIYVVNNKDAIIALGQKAWGEIKAAGETYRQVKDIINTLSSSAGSMIPSLFETDYINFNRRSLFEVDITEQSLKAPVYQTAYGNLLNLSAIAKAASHNRDLIKNSGNPIVILDRIILEPSAGTVAFKGNLDEAKAKIETMLKKINAICEDNINYPQNFSKQGLSWIANGAYKLNGIKILDSDSDQALIAKQALSDVLTIALIHELLDDVAALVGFYLEKIEKMDNDNDKKKFEDVLKNFVIEVGKNIFENTLSSKAKKILT